MKFSNRLVLLTGFLFIIYGCQKDDFTDTKTELFVPSISSYILYDGEVPDHILSFVRTKSDNTLKVNISANNISFSKHNGFSQNRETPLGVVQTNKVVQVYNERNTKYTFKVTDPTNAQSKINLIVVDTGEEIIEYFIQYIFDPNNPAPILNSGAIDMSRFTGAMIFYDSNGSIIGNYIFDNGIEIQSSGSTNPCPEDESIDHTDNTESSTGGGTNGETDTGNQGSTENNTSGSGELNNTDEPCGLEWEYGWCGCETGPLDGHAITGNPCCSGSPLIVTDTCTGQTWSSNDNQTQFREGTSPCDGDTGVIVELEGTETSVSCDKINEQLNDPNYINAAAELEGYIGETKEYGKAQSVSGEFSDVPQDPNNGDQLNVNSFMNDPNIFGFIHTHLDDLVEILPTGNTRITPKIRMFSPFDVRTFLLLVKNAEVNNINVADVYVTMLSSSGDFTLKFDGNIQNLIDNLDTDLLNYLGGQDAANDFNDYVKNYGRRLGLLKFMEDKIDINGINLYNIKPNGTIKRNYIDDSGKLKVDKCD
ncbi:hypothetical protein [Psychroserpens sp.]|uniref:hypothetical protein n=1 Tax=Psychroserpens sp. TaxID=2020870 RepID=UPI001AFCF271|nr:hypothetical protein [Psychroserpens sp.]MBO6605316.1 hypothetical protein [Psychroserpens sp.]MBO6630001.1 hypothetical protein [Psychroserpens sp.]MBO6653875.1 hypothetical protein [Psychroserpens sp.]MBO6682196.1 hypothetical protein [Psychroserpens sp.]MBO6748690.1 hypothetical protein [Psychroserpens sp.]